MHNFEEFYCMCVLPFDNIITSDETISVSPISNNLIKSFTYTTFTTQAAMNTHHFLHFIMICYNWKKKNLDTYEQFAPPPEGKSSPHDGTQSAPG